MIARLSQDEAALLPVAIDLMRRSDRYAETEPQLARQYSRQAYELGQHSEELRRSIVQERIRMIVRNSDQHRIGQVLNAAQRRRARWQRRLKRAGVVLVLALTASFMSPAPVNELPDQSRTLAVRILSAPL